MEDANQRAIGVEMNGHVWDGTQWVPIAPGSPRNSLPRLHPQAGQPAGAPAPTLQMWQQRLPQSGGFTDPHYGYGLTRQTSDDLQFIVRFYKIVIIISIVGAILTMVFVPLLFGSLLAAIGGAFSQVRR